MADMGGASPPFILLWGGERNPLSAHVNVHGLLGDWFIFRPEAVFWGQ